MTSAVGDVWGGAKEGLVLLGSILWTIACFFGRMAIRLSILVVYVISGFIGVISGIGYLASIGVADFEYLHLPGEVLLWVPGMAVGSTLIALLCLHALSTYNDYVNQREYRKTPRPQ